LTDLEKYFQNNRSNLINKWSHYFEIYERYFSRYRNKEVVVLEIGIYQGGSLKMWKDYFGSKLKLYAIDINPLCKQFEDDNTKVFIGSQDDRNFLDSVKGQIPKVDILIDDGGHYMNQQIITFEELYEHIKSDGVYLCEDLHTSYWSSYNGGYKKPETFIEYTKNFIDFLNAWHSKTKELQVTEFTKSTYGVHFYDSIVVVEKREMKNPESKTTGIPIINDEVFSYDDTRNMKAVSKLTAKAKLNPLSFLRKK
jgi:hypothetical protein